MNPMGLACDLNMAAGVSKGQRTWRPPASIIGQGSTWKLGRGAVESKHGTRPLGAIAVSGSAVQHRNSTAGERTQHLALPCPALPCPAPQRSTLTGKANQTHRELLGHQGQELAEVNGAIPVAVSLRAAHRRSMMAALTLSPQASPSLHMPPNCQLTPPAHSGCCPLGPNIPTH
jgi:hypothetical protein